MTICTENIEKNCDTCYEVSRADTDLVFVYGLTPSTQYYLWVVDKFNTTYKVLITSGVDGSFTIDPTNPIYPTGLFNTFSGMLEIFISTDADGETVVPLTIYATNYNCVLLTITSTSETGCTPITPGCAPAYITDSNGSTIFEVPSGDSGECTECTDEDATVENTNQSYQNTIEPGGTLVLPNIDFTDSDETTTSVPSMENIIATPCGDTSFNMVVNQNGVEIYNEVWNSNDTNIININ